MARHTRVTFLERRFRRSAPFRKGEAGLCATRCIGCNPPPWFFLFLFCSFFLSVNACANLCKLWRTAGVSRRFRTELVEALELGLNPAGELKRIERVMQPPEGGDSVRVDRSRS